MIFYRGGRIALAMTVTAKTRQAAMIRAPLRRLIPRPARARAMVATVRTPYQTATRRAPARPGLAMITAGMSSPAMTLRVLLLNASLSVAAARPRRARKTAATALGMLVTAARTMAPVITPGTAQRVPRVDAVRSMAALATTTTARARTARAASRGPPRPGWMAP